MHALVGASSVGPVVHVTGNFTSEGPLSPATREALLAAFDQGWADPKKLSQNSAKAAILRNSALENLASQLGVAASTLEVIGEPALGHFLAIAGILSPSDGLTYSSIDKGKVRAIARAHTGVTTELPVTSTGEIILDHNLAADSVFSLQLANGETGVIQDSQELSQRAGLIAIDATASGPRLPLPERWHTALFDSASWNGPAGMAFLAIKDSSRYSYPLPHIAPIKSPGSYSLPLLIASALALEEFAAENPALRSFAIGELSKVEGLTVVAANSPSLPHIFSVVLAGISGENLVRELASRNVDIDSGSACNPEDLQPSHVLAAMGYEVNGHLRITLHDGVTEKDITDLTRIIAEVALLLRG